MNGVLLSMQDDDHNYGLNIYFIINQLIYSLDNK